MQKILNKNTIIITLLAIVTVKVILSLFINITADEGYYLLWSKHLDWSYVDHPGMIAWLGFVFRKLFVNDLVAVRALSLTVSALSTYFVYLTARELVSERSSLQTALLFCLVPYVFFVNIMVVDILLLLFATIAFYFFVKLLKSKNTLFFYPLMIACGLGVLSKYTMVLLMAGMVLALLFRREYRNMLFSWHCMASILLFMVMMSPIVYWNTNHEWLSLEFHMLRVSGDKPFGALLSFAGMAILYYSPVYIYYFLLGVIKFRENRDPIPGAIVMLLFFNVAFWGVAIAGGGEVYGHYLVALIAPYVVFIAALHTDKIPRILALSAVPVAAILLLGTVTTPFPQLRLAEGNEELREEIKNLDEMYDGTLHLYADHFALVGLMSYCTGRPVYYPREVKKTSVRTWGAAQLKLWDRPVIKKGDSVLFYSRRLCARTEKLLYATFSRVEAVDSIDLQAFETTFYKSRNYTFYHLIDAKEDMVF